MRVDVDIALLEDCANRHWDFMREYRLTGDIKYLKGFVMDIIEAATQEKSNDDMIKEFDLALTDRERHALVAIYQQIGQSGNISVVKMVQHAGVSRPVIDNLLNKLKTYGIAEVTNQGVKGTNIVFLVDIMEALS